MLSSTNHDRRPLLTPVRVLALALAAFLALTPLTAGSAQAASGPTAAARKSVKHGKKHHRRTSASASRQQQKKKPRSEPAPENTSTETPTTTSPTPESTTTSPTPTTTPETTTEPAPAPAPEPTTTSPAPESTSAPEAEAAPAPAPSPSALFSGVKVRDFWINHSASGALSETTDPTGTGASAIKMTVSDGDVYPITPTENPRAELLSPSLIKPGMEFWLSTKFFVPTNYPSVPANGWVSLVSIYGAPFNGPSPWRLEIAGNNLQWQRNETYNWDVPYQAPLPKGSWVEVLTHERFGSDGFVEMWINGKRIQFFGANTYNPRKIASTEKLQMATMDASNNGDTNSAKIMQYRKAGMFNSGTIYFGPLKIGASKASVEG
jgi:outer membrane biosynthesis protein TonB